ncbi:hypothetical protein RvY_03683 [Ramazzottius varieornatus]|uniref:Uncharacterized protein n=1 Tax=Ramazzottius varieornatus TaxID=947166 RepID=A0A1D1UUL5_RAMVA|nr:hypothetical protein RvY_03683 [Ramazzottius varieornatus]
MLWLVHSGNKSLGAGCHTFESLLISPLPPSCPPSFPSNQPSRCTHCSYAPPRQSPSSPTQLILLPFSPRQIILSVHYLYFPSCFVVSVTIQRSRYSYFILLRVTNNFCNVQFFSSLH